MSSGPSSVVSSVSAAPVYFHGAIDRTEATRRLRAHGVHGSFLVRTSKNSDNSRPFSISILRGTHAVRHIRVCRHPSRGYFLEGCTNVEPSSTVQMLVDECMSGAALCNLADDTDAVYMHEPLASPQHRLCMSERWGGSSMCSSSTSSFAPMVRSQHNEAIGRRAKPFGRPMVGRTHQSQRSSILSESPLSPNDLINLDLWSNVDRKSISTQRNTQQIHSQGPTLSTSPVPRIQVSDVANQSHMRSTQHTNNTDTTTGTNDTKGDVDALHEDLDNLPMDVKNFLSGRTNARSIARRRSMKFLPDKTKV
eukprot:m.151525 g.151525  ORF g.151525 m.151525 type:complete len:308 (+) comp17868_c0_seq2:407-1330(+)